MLLPLTDTVAIPLLLEVAEIAPVPGRVATTVPLRVLSFLKLTFLEGISWKITRRLFHVDARSACERKIIRLARQTPLSCAEIIKCIEMDIRRLKDGYDVLDKLYDDNDLNCDNFAQAVREYRCSREVITAVANLYLRQQIMIDTY